MADNAKEVEAAQAAVEKANKAAVEKAAEVTAKAVAARAELVNLTHPKGGKTTRRAIDVGEIAGLKRKGWVVAATKAKKK